MDASVLGQFARLATQPLFVVGVILYGATAVAWFFALSLEDLSTSYPILVGATFICVALGAILFFQESMSLSKAIGMIVIVVGIAFVASTQ